jgi:hypothetical protein
MNRLILIGNGFDLAHHLKTSYSDFVKDYISSCINHFADTGDHKDLLLEMTMKDRISVPVVKNSTTADNALSKFDILKSNPKVIMNIKSKFWEDTLIRVSTINWVDLENDYFEHLIALKEGIKFDFDQVKKLNAEFDFIKDKLKDYLSSLDSESKSKYIEDYTQQFLAPIRYYDFVFKNPVNHGQTPERIAFINFNYTCTVQKYLDRCTRKTKCELIHIHGELGKSHNPIIFGFGDEFNKNYIEFEDLRNKELLKHIKSFAYFKTSNYHNLIRFITSNDFEVFTFGHSLGLSDRTMLKQIFEHKNCISIKIFYHQLENGSSDYTDKTYDISSHFSDKEIMRLKIVPQDKSFSMTQTKID